MAWIKGQSGNPRGRQSGRQELGDAFIRVLKSDWEANGAATIIVMRQKDPVAYVRVVAAMLPEQVEMEVGQGLAALLGQLGTIGTNPESAGDVIPVEAPGPGTVCH
jgi:hypothetical protein